MNVLILTPDRVGSTLLQRLLTVYMLRKGFDQPVINLHELTNGLIKYYNETLNQEVLGKPRDRDGWGYFQTLHEVVELLKSVDHYKTSRLAHYHILNRGDSQADQMKFYDYLNKNFYIISCRRENLFEHALSWVIYSHSKKLNVYSVGEKIDNFTEIYQTGITGFQEQIEFYLDRYKLYIEWANKNFNVQSYFYYDKDINSIEQYILGLDFMKNNQANTWKDMFGQEFSEYNTCGRILPNLILDNNRQGEYLINYTDDRINKEHYDLLKGADWPDYNKRSQPDTLKNLPAVVQKELNLLRKEYNNIPVDKKTYDFLIKNVGTYSSTNKQLDKLVDNGFLVTNIPLKLQSLEEKSRIIINFDECIDWYNSWVDKTNFGIKYTKNQLSTAAASEESILNSSINLLLK